jgi:enoyl-CoA hydratase
VIGFEAANHIAVVTLSRPEARNSIDPDTTRDLADAFDTIEADDEVWVSIITGAPPVFCAGADLKAINAGREKELSDVHGFASITNRVRTKPLIAAVAGPALAGGTEIVLASDLVVAERTASFGIPEVKRGILAAAGGLYRLPRVLPRNIALELGLTGDPITAPRAAELGLVNVLCENGSALTNALRLAERVTANAPIAVRESRRLMLATPYESDDVGRSESRAAMKRALDSQDAAEGVRAFLEKRPPVWTGR